MPVENIYYIIQGKIVFIVGNLEEIYLIAQEISEIRVTSRNRKPQ